VPAAPAPPSSPGRWWPACAGSVISTSRSTRGCIETSRPTTIDEPTFVTADVVHYCVPNMTANIPRTASKALTLAHLGYLELLAEQGVDGALRREPALARGATMYRGSITTETIASLFGLEHRSLDALLGGGGTV
jgi:alanine dehydrogenase